MAHFFTIVVFELSTFFVLTTFVNYFYFYITFCKKILLIFVL